MGEPCLEFRVYGYGLQHRKGRSSRRPEKWGTPRGIAVICASWGLHTCCEFTCTASSAWQKRHSIVDIAGRLPVLPGNTVGQGEKVSLFSR